MISSISRFLFWGGWPFLPDDLRWPWPALCLSWMLKTAWDGHREPTYQISTHSYNGADRNRSLYTNSLRAYTISQCVVVLRLRFFLKLSRLRHSFLHVKWRCYDAHLVLISSILEQAKVLNKFRLQRKNPHCGSAWIRPAADPRHALCYRTIGICARLERRAGVRYSPSIWPCRATC